MKNRSRLLDTVISIMVIVSMIVAACPDKVEAKMKTTKIQASVLNQGKQYTMKKMPYNGVYSPLPQKYKGKKLYIRALQNFQETPDGKFVFAVGEGITGNLKSGIRNTILCRCTIPDNRNAEAEADCEQAHILEKYGHSDNIGITQPDLNQQVYYLWLVSAAGNYTSAALGTEVVRIRYEVDAYGNGKMTQTVTLKKFLYTKIVKEKGKLKAKKQGDKISRVSLTVNQEDNLIAFRVQCKNKNVNYTVYDLNALNTILDGIVGNGSYNMDKAKKLQLANVACTFTPSTSFQSMAIDKKYIYMCGGYPERDTVIYKVPYKTYAKGKVKIQTLKKRDSNVKQRIIIYPSIRIHGKNYDKKTIEVEGIMIKKNPDTSKIDYYLLFRAAGTSIRNTVAIYKITA